ncbi:hypothetical protein Tco_0871494 [Tanacetum coccineum]
MGSGEESTITQGKMKMDELECIKKVALDIFPGLTRLDDDSKTSFLAFSRLLGETKCTRQGFALGLAMLAGAVSNITLESLWKLIVDLLKVSSPMRGQLAWCGWSCGLRQEVVLWVAISSIGYTRRLERAKSCLHPKIKVEILKGQLGDQAKEGQEWEVVAK